MVIWQSFNLKSYNMRAKYLSVTDRAQVRPVFFGQLWIAPPFTFKSVPSLEDKLCKHSIK